MVRYSAFWWLSVSYIETLAGWTPTGYEMMIVY